MFMLCQMIVRTHFKQVIADMGYMAAAYNEKSVSI